MTEGLLTGTMTLETGPTLLTFEGGHGIHQGDVLLVASLLPLICLFAWLLARNLLGRTGDRPGRGAIRE